MTSLDLREYGDWPLPHRAAACVLLSLLAFGLPWLLLTRPTTTQWQALKSAEHDLQIRLLQTRQQADTLPELPPLTPDEPPLLNIPALITTLAETAHTAGLHGGQFRQAPPSATDASTDGIPIELRLHGTWPQLTRFASDLAAPTPDATISLRDIRLRSQATESTPLLELSATVLIYPHANAVSEHHTSAAPPRNPFIDTTFRLRPTNTHAVIGSLGNGQGQVGLVLTADGELRRVRGAGK